MPGPEKRPGSTPDPIQQFISGLAAATGLDPNVVAAWVKIEGAFTSGGTGGYNYLNLRPAAGGRSYSGVPLAGVSSGNFSQFGSVSDAVTETAHWINTFSNYAGIRTSTKQSPRAQIAAIAASPWDAGHYGGDGSSLLASYIDIITHPSSFWHALGGVLSSAGQGVQNIVANGPVVGGLENVGGIAGAVGVPGASTAVDLVKAPLTLMEDGAKALEFLANPNDWLRIGYMLAGGTCIVLGVALLARSVGGISISTPGGGQASSQSLPTDKDLMREFQSGVNEGTRQGARREGRKQGRSSVAGAGTPKSKVRSTPGPAARPSRPSRRRGSASGAGANQAIPF